VRLFDRTAREQPREGDRFRVEEDATYEVRIAEHLTGASVRFGGRLLPARTPCSFELSIGRWAGAQSLELRLGERRLDRSLIEVHPRGTKLDPDAWRLLLQELDERVAGLSFGATGGRRGSVGREGAALEGLSVAALELLPSLLVAIQRLLEAPRERARGHWVDLPMHQVRRIDPGTVRWLARTPIATHALYGAVAAQDRTIPHAPQHLLEPDLDHPANRYLCWLLQRVSKRLASLEARLERKPRDEDEDTQAWREHRRSLAADGRAALDRLLRRSFLRRLAPEGPSEAALLTFQDDPAYARVHRLCGPLLSPRFLPPTGERADTVPIRPTHGLYELWTFFALQRLLERSLPGSQWRPFGLRRMLAGSGSGAAFVARTTFGRLALWFNPTFRGLLAGPSARRRSLSGERRPDLVVTFQPNVGEGRWVCLDAKFRYGAPNVADALTTAHTYRDALIWDGLGGRCRSAWLLVPSLDAASEVWADLAFEERFGFGVARMAPGVATEPAFASRVLARLGVPRSTGATVLMAEPERR